VCLPNGYRGLVAARGCLVSCAVRLVWAVRHVPVAVRSQRPIPCLSSMDLCWPCVSHGRSVSKGASVFLGRERKLVLPPVKRYCAFVSRSSRNDVALAALQAWRTKQKYKFINLQTAGSPASIRVWAPCYYSDQPRDVRAVFSCHS
jgi:hypothetical protein